MSDEQKRRAAADAADAGPEAAAKRRAGAPAAGQQDRAAAQTQAKPSQPARAAGSGSPAQTAGAKGGEKPAAQAVVKPGKPAAAKQPSAAKQSAAAKSKAARQAGAVDQVSVSDGALAKIIGLSAHEVPGIVGMAPASFTEGIRRILGARQADEGVVLARSADGRTADVDMHVVVAYGVNIPVVAESVRDRVRYAAKQLAGIELDKIRVHVAGVSRA